jgi:hypothetical protein
MAVTDRTYFEKQYKYENGSLETENSKTTFYLGEISAFGEIL